MKLCALLLLALGIAQATLIEQPVQLFQEPDAPTGYSGYYLQPHDIHIFYLYYPAADSVNAETAPLTLWMTGGPGCSSELAYFVENGPAHITKNLTLEPNKYGWNQASHMLYVDQPVGVGFSYTDDPRDSVSGEAGVAADMLIFLQEFLEAHPEHAERPFYVTGESYGGHYVPAVSYAIFLQNKLESSFKFNLQGLAIGNGLTDPAIQFAAYADYAELNGLIDSATRDGIKRIMPVCKFLVDACNGYPWLPFVCSLAFTVCQTTQVVPTLVATGRNLNVYDIRKECEGPLCYDFSRIDKYLAQPDVRAKLGVPSDLKFQECNFDVNAAFASDYARRFDQPNIVDMLNAGLKVLIYAGVEDFICNWLGNSRWLAVMPWSGLEGYTAAPEENILLPNGTVGGTVKAYKNLSFIKGFRAGHMLPWDQPEFALLMFSHFLSSSAEQGSVLQGPGHWAASTHKAQA